MKLIVFLGLLVVASASGAKECESDSISETFNRLANFVVEKHLPDGKYLIQVNAPKKIETVTFDFMGYGLELDGKDVLGLDVPVSEVGGFYQSYITITKDILSKSSFTVMYSPKPNLPGSCTYTYWMPNNVINKLDKK